jgi:type II secretory pathway pseudopilin PulG
MMLKGVTSPSRDANTEDRTRRIDAGIAGYGAKIKIIAAENTSEARACVAFDQGILGSSAGKMVFMRIGRFHRRATQSGYVLMAILFLLALLMIGLMATAPAIKTQIQRDREEEMIHRGAQYARAIKKYVKKFGRYPASLDQLKETNTIRFLRKEYQDPMSPDGKWRLLHVGDVQLSTTSNFGTPVSALSSPVGTAASAGQSGLTMGGSPGFTAPGKPGSSSSASTLVLGGGVVIGVASLSEKEGLHVFNDKTHYNEWYFIYDPQLDRGGLINGPYTGKTFGPAGVVGTPVGAMGQQPSAAFGQPSSFGQQPSSLGQPSPSPQQPTSPR